MTVAALFVEKDGCYFGLPGIDPWDKERDARKYTGPHPVVAHPPCQLWVNFAALNYKRHGGAHNMPGNDGGCFAHALWAVRRFGGVLEHPAFSNAWEFFRLTPPPRDLIAGTDVDWTGWLQTGLREWTCEVWQSAYGHPARKRTWLYYVGDRAPSDMEWLREAGTHQVGWFDRIKPALGKKAANATPPAFRDALIALAANAAPTQQLTKAVNL